MNRRITIAFGIIGIIFAACLIGLLAAVLQGQFAAVAALPAGVQRVQARQSYYASCGQAVEDNAQPAQMVETLPLGAITRLQAAKIVSDALYGCDEPNSNLALYNATYPDGQQRLSWAGVCLTNVRRDPVSYGELNIVYVDAMSGKVLMIVTGASSGDLGMACGMGAPEFSRLMIERVSSFVVIWIASTAGLLVAAGLGAVLWRARRRPTETES